MMTTSCEWCNLYGIRYTVYSTVWSNIAGPTHHLCHTLQNKCRDIAVVIDCSTVKLLLLYCILLEVILLRYVCYVTGCSLRNRGLNNAFPKRWPSLPQLVALEPHAASILESKSSSWNLRWATVVMKLRFAILKAPLCHRPSLAFKNKVL